MDSRALIVQADQLARKKGLSQAKWSSIAGYSPNGQTVCRIMAAGDCRVSTFIALLQAIGCDLEITEGECEGNG